MTFTRLSRKTIMQRITSHIRLRKDYEWTRITGDKLDISLDCDKVIIIDNEFCELIVESALAGKSIILFVSPKARCRMINNSEKNISFTCLVCESAELEILSLITSNKASRFHDNSSTMPDKVSNEILLIENNASISYSEACIVSSDIMTSRLNVIHKSPKTSSTINIRGVVLESSTLKSYINVRINKEARLSSTSQHNHLLLVSDSSHGEAFPSLEVDDDNVQASHSASVGCIDKEKLFYIQSRGLSATQAKNTIIKGFLRQIIDAAEFDDNKVEGLL